MLVFAFVSILGLNPGAVPRMGLHPVAPAPFGSCLFLFMLFIYVVYPIKLLKKEKKRMLNKCITNSSLVQLSIPFAILCTSALTADRHTSFSLV